MTAVVGRTDPARAQFHSGQVFESVRVVQLAFFIDGDEFAFFGVTRPTA
jgi:hypothetical protein